MRTTIILSDELINRAIKETGITQKTKLLHMGLEALIEKKSRERLANLFGSNKNAKSAKRKREVSY